MSTIISKRFLIESSSQPLATVIGARHATQTLRDNPEETNFLSDQAAHLGSKNIAKNEMTKSETGRNLE